MNRIRLSKFALEENYPISDLILFLNQNGFKKREDSNELISENEIQFVKNNFNSYLSQNSENYKQYKNKFLKKFTTKSDVNTPVQLKIIEAANREKLLVERIIGFTDFDWEFLIAKYNGEVSQPVPFSVFDEIICDLLLVENLSKRKIGEILGLNVADDPAERAIVEKSLKSLKDEDIIEGTTEGYQLTDIGKEYAKNGIKYSYFNRDFTIYFDTTGRNQEHAKSELRKLKSEKSQLPVSAVPVSVKQIREFALFQSPEVHFPENNYILQSTTLIKAEKYVAKLWVIFLDNFKENMSRVLVYDENQNKIVEQLSNDLNNRDDLKKHLLEKLVQDTDEFSITEDVKSLEQIHEENELIEKQNLLDVAKKTENIIEVQKLQREFKTQKRSFNSTEFELELKEIFEESNDELWFVSPWLRYHAIKYRYNYFEQQLRQGAKIFIVYSLPEKENDVMAEERAKKMLDELESKYRNFYIHQLPKFHYKNVWIRNKNSPNILYTGSFNILSFYVDKNSKNVRQEQMVKIDWNDETDSMYSNFIEEFGKKYIMKEGQNFNNLIENVPSIVDVSFVSKIKTIDSIKLNTFRNIGYPNFDKTLDQLEKSKNTALKQLGKEVFLKDLMEIQNQVETFFNKRINRITKKKLLDSFEALIQDYYFFKDDFSEELNELYKKIGKLQTSN